jgi:phosphoribosylformylglycinamidine synthase
VLVTLLEMAFAGHCGLDVEISCGVSDSLATLCAEELGAVIQVRAADVERVRAVLREHGVDECTHDIGQVIAGDSIRIMAGKRSLRESRTVLRRLWSETSWRMQRLRDNPVCADQSTSGRDENDPIERLLTLAPTSRASSTEARPPAAPCANRASTARPRWLPFRAASSRTTCI